MKKEIERKFNVSDLLVGIFPIHSIGDAIEQGYIISDENIEMRIRCVNGNCFMTVKSDGTLSRSEWETDIPREVFEALRPKVVGRFTKKMRHIIPCEVPWSGFGTNLELDIYLGELHGLITFGMRIPKRKRS